MEAKPPNILAKGEYGYQTILIVSAQCERVG